MSRPTGKKIRITLARRANERFWKMTISFQAQLPAEEDYDDGTHSPACLSRIGRSDQRHAVLGDGCSMQGGRTTFTLSGRLSVSCCATICGQGYRDWDVKIS